MIDAGWRVLLGQAPSRDFIVTFPPSLYLSVAWAYRWFGISWHAIAVMECLLYAAILVLGIRTAALVHRAWNERIATLSLLSFFIGQTMLLVSINYPWHASMAQSFAMYAALAALPLLGSKRLQPLLEIEAYTHLLLATALLLLSKPNTAYPAVLLCFALIAYVRRTWIALAATLAGALLLDSVVLAHVHTSLWAMGRVYSGLTGRLYPRGLTMSLLQNIDPHFGLVSLVVYFGLAPLLLALLVWLWNKRDPLASVPAALLGLGCIAVAILGMATNFDFKLTDTPLLLLGATFLVGCAEAPRPIPSRTFWATMAMLLLALYIGRSRYRMMWAYLPCERVAIHGPFLGSIKVCPDLQQELVEVNKTLAAYPRANVFFGPSLEFLYAAHHIPSPAHLPDWWDPGTSFALRDSGKVTQAWSNDHFTLLIFRNKEDRGHMLPSVTAQMDRNYERVGNTQAIHVYRLQAADQP